jgi:hypothetical protein
MRTHRIIAAVLALLVLRADARADANSLNDGLGPREISVGESMRADARGSLATTLNPAGLALNNELVFEGSYGYRPGDEASAVAVSACDSTVPIPGCFYYRYFTATPELGGEQLDRRAHEFGAVAARRLSPRVLIGITSKYFDYESDVPDEGNKDGFGFDLGVTVLASNAVNVAFVGHNIWAADTAQYPRAVAGGVMVRPSPMLSLGFDALWNLDTAEGESTGRYGGGAEYYFSSADRQNGYPLRAGAVYDNQLEATYITGGVGFLSGKMGLDVGARKQVDGGDELMIHASLRLFGPRMAAAPVQRGW